MRQSMRIKDRALGEWVPTVLLAVVSLLAIPSAHTTEYFVAKHGSDEADGLSETTAFATIAGGIARLTPGDTLTILPGHYFEAISAQLSGTPEAPITIRAKRPGTVLLRGDVDVSGFRLASGMQYTYWTAFDQPVEGVADRANLRLYEPVLSLPEVEQNLATFYYDPDEKRLYVHTADSSPPDGNALSVSVTDGFGILLTPPQGSKTVHDVVIDGLSFTGYNSREYPDGPGSRSRWGLHVVNGERVIIRRCTSFLNAGGIFLVAPSECIVEDCYAFANFGRFLGLGGNILAWSGHNTTFRRNVVESFCEVPTSSADIAFYGGARADGKTPGGLMENNLAINAGLMIKGSFGEDTAQRGNCVVGSGAYFHRLPDPTNLLLGDHETAGTLRTYADPIAHDYRLQSAVPQRGKGPDGAEVGPFPYRDEVFFVSPTGDDSQPGTSVALAWRTLGHAAGKARAGQTVYVTAGVYNEALRPAQSGAPGQPIRFLRRGRDQVVLDGEGREPVGIDLAGRSHIHIRGFIVRNVRGNGLQASDGADIRIEQTLVLNSDGVGVAASGVQDLVVEYSLLRNNSSGGLALERCPGALIRGTIFDRNGGPAVRLDQESLQGLWSDTNAFVPSAQPRVAVGDEVFSTLAVWQAARGQDPNSLAAEPGYRDADGDDFSLREDSPLIGRGPLARPIGPYLRVPTNAPLRIETSTVRAITATTATIECWTPTVRTAVDIEWGNTPECENQVRTPAAILHNVGLIGLQPGSKYFYRVRPAERVERYCWAPHAAEAPADRQPAAPVAADSFETLTADGPARTFHVAVTGDDRHSGRSAPEAWRTIAHAAGHVRAGDTVLIHSGTYSEFVLVRATGDRQAPITFRAAPGATVWLEGGNRLRSTAFRLEAKHHIHMDGLRFRHFRYLAHAGGCIGIEGGSNNVVRRCFHDGRERDGYVTDFLRAVNTADLLVENCVMINGMGTGVTLNRCPGALVQHCVFYNNFIRAMDVVHWDLARDPSLVFTASHNLICDTIPGKTGNPLFRLAHLDCLRSDHNGYFVRQGPDQRSIVQAYNFQGKPIGLPGSGAWSRGEKLLIEDVRKLTGQETGSIFGNPGIRAVSELMPPGASRADWLKTEMHWDGTAFAPLVFEDFMADPAGPFGRSAAGKPIGLDPAAFR